MKPYYSTGYSSYNRDQAGTPPVPGGTGLSNLGNTCFMNSTIQCLSNTAALRDFFVSEDFKKDVNTDNPLGHGGKIAEEYSGVMSRLWGGEFQSISPAGLKKSIGEFAPQFTGYNQQDSQELLSFLLDALHEDLNRVRKKPPTEKPESNGRADEIVAKEAWDVHLMRNQSIVVDLFQGQLRSELVCPACNAQSITFDPFMYLIVPLPQKVTKEQKVTVSGSGPGKKPLQITVDVPTNGTMGDLIKAVCDLVPGIVDPSRIAIADVVQGNRIYKLFTDKNSVSEFRPVDDIWMIECDNLSEGADPADVSRVQVVQRKQVRATYTNTLTHQKWSHPRVLMFDEKATTNATVRAHLAELAKTTAEVQSLTGLSEDAFQISVVDNYATAAGAALPDDEKLFTDAMSKNQNLSIDWNPQASAGLQDQVPDTHASMKKGGAEGGVDGAVPLIDCMQKFTQVEQLGEDDAWYCSKCKEFQQATKKMDVWTLPEVLIIIIKRFQQKRWGNTSFGSLEKIDTAVDFPDELDMGAHTLNPALKGTMYDLYAVSNHSGGMSGGHYYSYAKGGSGPIAERDWYEYNDSTVRKMSADKVRTKAAYVLFYQRRPSVQKVEGA